MTPLSPIAYEDQGLQHAEPLAPGPACNPRPPTYHSWLQGLCSSGLATQVILPARTFYQRQLVEFETAQRLSPQVFSISGLQVTYSGVGAPADDDVWTMFGLTFNGTCSEDLLTSYGKSGVLGMGPGNMTAQHATAG